jgi:hypothetical protein
MKKFLFVAVVLSIAAFANAQKMYSTKWHTFYIGGNKGYFVKTYNIGTDSVIENQFGSGGQFDNKPTTIPVQEIVTTETEERVITKYGDNSFYLIVFKDFTANKANVFFGTDEFKTVAEAKAFVPKADQYIDWFTQEGYAVEDKKPVMKTFTKADAKELLQFMGTTYNKVAKEMNLQKDDPRELGLAMMVAFLPTKFAENKGFHAYKSLPVIDKAMKKLKYDPEIKKLIKEFKLGEVL